MLLIQACQCQLECWRLLNHDQAEINVTSSCCGIAIVVSSALALSGNQLTGSIPSTIGGATSLQYVPVNQLHLELVLEVWDSDVLNYQVACWTSASGCPSESTNGSVRVDDFRGNLDDHDCSNILVMALTMLLGQGGGLGQQSANGFPSRYHRRTYVDDVRGM